MDKITAFGWRAAAHLNASWLSYLLVLVPLVYFGAPSDLKNLAWKIIVVCTGWIVFHLLSTQMFPFLKPQAIIRGLETGKLDVGSAAISALVFLGECILLGLLAFATIFGIASGL